MRAIATLGRALRTATRVAVGRIRRHVSSVLDRRRADRRGTGRDEVAVLAGPIGGEGSTRSRQSTRRGSSTTLGDSPGPAGGGGFGRDDGSDSSGLGIRGGAGDDRRGHENGNGDGRSGQDGSADGTRGDPPGSLRPDPEPLDGLDRRDRPLNRPAGAERNGTMTEGRRRPDGRVRIEDPERGEAYLESDVSVSLDHLR